MLSCRSVYSDCCKRQIALNAVEVQLVFRTKLSRDKRYIVERSIEAIIRRYVPAFSVRIIAYGSRLYLLAVLSYRILVSACGDKFKIYILTLAENIFSSYTTICVSEPIVSVETLSPK